MSIRLIQHFKAFGSSLVRDDRGQDLIEYALLATFVALVAIAGASLLGVSLNNWYASTGVVVDGHASSAS
jgi:Flp pilus assembly pilin Flp